MSRAEAVDDDVGSARNDELTRGTGTPFAAELGMGLWGLYGGNEGLYQAVGGDHVVLRDVNPRAVEVMERPGRPEELQRRRHFLTIFLTWV